MFELQIRESSKESKVPGGSLELLKKTVECLLGIVDEAEFKVNEDEIRVQVMDSMHVALGDISLSKDLFDSYRCDRSLVLGVNLKSFHSILKDIHIEKGSVLEMYCRDDTPYLFLVHESNSCNLTFKVKLFSYDLETYSFPDLEYSAEINMKTEMFMMLSKVAGSFADTLSIDAEKGVATFMQKGEAGESMMVIKSGVHEEVEINVSEPVKKEIAMKYVKYISKAGALAQSVRTCMGKSSPIFFDFSMFGLGHMRFYIAPKVTN